MFNDTHTHLMQLNPDAPDHAALVIVGQLADGFGLGGWFALLPDTGGGSLLYQVVNELISLDDCELGG